MIRIIVVEDEKIFREYTVGLLDWEKYNMKVIGSAKNGQEALEIISKKQVDIALVDINMPIMNGLIFIEKAKEIWPQLKVILLTGYNEFEYAKTAIKLGVNDYILKPFDDKELEKAILAVKEKIVEERNQREIKNWQKKELLIEYANYLISDSYVKREREYEEFIIELQENVSIGAYRLVVMEEDFFDETWDSNGQSSLWRKTVLNMLEETFQEKYRAFCFCNENGKITVLLSFFDKAESENYQSEELELICRLVRQKLKFSITCAISDSFENLLNLRNIYDELELMLNQKSILGHGQVLHIAAEKELQKKYLYPKIPAQAIRKEFLDNNLEKIKSIICNLVEEMKHNKMNMEMTHLVYSELISICLAIIAERNEDIKKIYGMDFMPFTKIKYVYNMDMVTNYILWIYEEGIKYFTAVNYSRTKTIAKEAIIFIEEKYYNSKLSVESVANHLFINSSYLRSAFKKEVGITVSNYIFKVRMEKAHELIPKKNIKLNDIATLVGFNDGAYFSKCFKKEYGLTPSEYANCKRDM